MLDGLLDFLDAVQDRLEHVLQPVVSDEVGADAHLKFIQIVLELFNRTEQLSFPFLDPKRKRFNIDVMRAIDDRGERERVLAHAPRYYFLDAELVERAQQLAQKGAGQCTLKNLDFRCPVVAALEHARSDKFRERVGRVHTEPQHIGAAGDRLDFNHGITRRR